MKINNKSIDVADKLSDKDPRILNKKQKRFLVAINNKFVKVHGPISADDTAYQTKEN